MGRKREVKERLCKISRKVMDHFECHHAADCFCGDGNSMPSGVSGFQFSDKILDTIETAVDEWIQRNPFDPDKDGLSIAAFIRAGKSKTVVEILEEGTDTLTVEAFNENTKQRAKEVRP